MPRLLMVGLSHHAAPLEVRATPHVVIEGRWVDSQGRPKGGWGSFIFGRIDGSFWNAQTRPDAQGRFSLRVPHGLEESRLGEIELWVENSSGCCASNSHRPSASAGKFF